MNIMQKVTYILVVFILLCVGFSQTDAQSTADDFRAGLLMGVNNVREQADVTILIANDILSQVAQTSLEIVATANNYEAISTDSVDELLALKNYRHEIYWYAMNRNVTPEEAIDLWLDNYRSQMLSETYTELGTAYVENRFGDGYLMILLAKPGESALPTTIPPACENPIPPYPITGQDLNPAQSPERMTKIRVLTDLYDSLIRNWLNDALVPGAVIGLIDEGEFVWVNAYGYSDGRTYAPMTTDILFGVASFSKPIASVVAMQLVERNIITLDMPVFDVVTAWQPRPTYPLDEVTPYRLMSHTAGFPTANSPIFRENFSPTPTLIESLNGMGRRGVTVAMINPPGQTFAYSNGGYSVLQLFLETVTGESFADYTRCNIFEPLGMTMTDFYLRPDIQANHAVGHNEEGDPMPNFQIMVDLAAAGLHTSVPDFARWLVALLADPNVPNILSPESIALMMSPAEATDGQYGLGFYLTNWQGEIIPNHTGSTPGFRSYFQVLPNQRHGIIVLTNSSNGEVFNNRVVGQWLQWLKSIGEIEGNDPVSLELEREVNINQLIQLINDERASNQLPPLLINDFVLRDAQSNSQMMAARDDVEEHDLGRFSDRMASWNYDFDYFYYWAAYGAQLTAQGAFDIWKREDDTFTRLFLDESFNDIGIGMSTSGSGVNYYSVLVVRR